jgi:hypothetical protein
MLYELNPNKQKKGCLFALKTGSKKFLRPAKTRGLRPLHIFLHIVRWHTGVFR